MRYLIAMAFAAAFAGTATVFVSSPLASWAVGRFTFDNPDSVGELHALVFIATNLTALVAGWLFGWAVAGWMAPQTAAPTHNPAPTPPAAHPPEA